MMCVNYNDPHAGIMYKNASHHHSMVQHDQQLHQHDPGWFVIILY